MKWLEDLTTEGRDIREKRYAVEKMRAEAKIYEAGGTTDKQRAFDAEKFNKQHELELEKLQLEREKLKLEEKALKIRELEAKATLTGHRVRRSELELTRRGFQPAVQRHNTPARGNNHAAVGNHQVRSRESFRANYDYHSPEPRPAQTVTIFDEDDGYTRALQDDFDYQIDEELK
jgi:hypothetical protein